MANYDIKTITLPSGDVCNLHDITVPTIIKGSLAGSSTFAFSASASTKWIIFLIGATGAGKDILLINITSGGALTLGRMNSSGNVTASYGSGKVTLTNGGTNPTAVMAVQME